MRVFPWARQKLPEDARLAGSCMRAYTVNLSAPIVGVRSCMSASCLSAFSLLPQWIDWTDCCWWGCNVGFIYLFLRCCFVFVCFPKMSERLPACTWYKVRSPLDLRAMNDKVLCTFALCRGSFTPWYLRFCCLLLPLALPSCSFPLGCCRLTPCYTLSHSEPVSYLTIQHIPHHRFFFCCCHKSKA